MSVIWEEPCLQNNETSLKLNQVFLEYLGLQGDLEAHVLYQMLKGVCA